MRDSQPDVPCRDICYRCLRPLSSCYCKYIKPFDSGVKFVLLMHPKEAKRQRTGTGRLASLTLEGSEILVGVDFSSNARLNALLSDPGYYPVLLYPGPDAWTAGKEGFKESLGGRKLLVIIIDSTWACSKKMIKLSKNVLSLPKFSFSGSYRSIYTFKREPKEYCVSSIESCYYLIKELQAASVVSASVDPEPLMDVFKELVKFQLEKENERISSGVPGSHAYDWKYTTLKQVPESL
ncbi:MAG: DTW domain-containing protein [Treponema sp.]|nr:DTW domain-containing protein [Treponema sp.]